MWEELSKSVKAVLYDRIASPLLGTFAVSWLLWNHRFVTVFLSGMEPAEKFDFVDTVLYPTWECVLWQMVAFPLLTTILFIFLYPYPARFVFEFTRKQQKRLKEIRQRIEDETPLTLVESKQIRSAALQAQLLYEKDMRALTEENQQLRAELQRLLAQSDKTSTMSKESLDKPTTESRKVETELSDEAVRALVLLSMQQKMHLESYLIEVSKDMKISAIRSRHLYDVLKAGDYIDRSIDDTVYLTPKGRALLVSHDLA